MTSINTINPFKPQNKALNKETELGIFYTNDSHGDIYRLGKFKTAHDEFKLANKNIANMTLSGGDSIFSSDSKLSKLLVKVFNAIHLDALALGNHEFSAGSKTLNETLKDADFKAVSSNLNITENNPLQESIKNKKLVKSAVFMKNGHKFAVIGASPIDSYIGKAEKSIKPMDMDKTIKAINTEAKKLEEQGINKIILCSHLGYGEKGDLEVARKTEGIDIIVGGHTHTLIDGVNTKTTDKTHRLNLLSSKRNEPVIITQAGGLNEHAGYLNVVFDEKGVINTEKIQNKVVKLDDFNNSSYVSKLMNNILGKKEVLAKVKNPYNPKNSYEERYLENPIANYFADAIIDYADKSGKKADVSLFQAAGIRGGAGSEITNYDIKYRMLPFNNEIKIIDMTEKDFVNVVNNMTGSLLKSRKDPQVLRCSGMNYSIHNDVEFAKSGKENALINMQIGNRNIDVENPDENKTIRVAVNSYLFSHDLVKDIFSKYKDNAQSLAKEQDIFIDYLKNHKELDCSTDKPKRVNLTHQYSSLKELHEYRDKVIDRSI